jgi:hypothetical protein
MLDIKAKGNYSIKDEIGLKNIEFLKKNIFRNLPVVFQGVLADIEMKFYRSPDELPSTRRQEILNESIIAETFEDKNEIDVYLFVLKTREDFAEEFFLTIYHELFHLFSHHCEFYKQLDKVLRGQKEDFLMITKEDIEKFLKEISTFDVDRYINQKRMMECWNKKYLQECAEDERDNGILKYIERGDLRAMVEEIFAETFAEMILKKSIQPECLPFETILKKIFEIQLGGCC